MKINWFSPIPPAKTDIAHYTARIMPALYKFADFTIWTDQIEYEKAIEKYASIKIYDYSNFPWWELNHADLSVFNIGNHPVFHESIWHISRQHPGLIILHDFRLQHLFAGLYKDKYKDKEFYLTKMRQYYGEEGYREGKAFWDGQYDTEYMANKYPLTSLALENAIGVIVHSIVTFDLLARIKSWPLAYFPLPYPSTYAFQKVEQNEMRHKGPYRLITFGYLGPNRQLETILKAIADYHQKNRFRLDIYGQIWDREYLNNLIKAQDLEGLVFLHGFVSENELDSALSIADLAFNLRYPTMGEASGSQLRIWDHSLPSLVTPVGWYGTLSKDEVAFVNPESPIKDIQKHLDAFLENPGYFQNMGKNGRRKLEAEHDPQSFAKMLMDFIPMVKGFRRVALSYKLAEKVGGEMNDWIDLEEMDKKIRTVAEAIWLLTCKNSSMH